ncbi:MAG: 50S ribosomal protein L17 [Geobacter sp.]|nr:50S ribosomal protein L17 [Geobacter sp.]
MRHGKAGRRLGRKTSHREAMFRNMVTSLLNHEKITTTDAKAKEIRVVAERMITLGKRGDLHSMRLAAAVIREKSVVSKLFSTIAPRYKDRPGGYTRIVKLGVRQGDAAPTSLIELVEEEMKPSKVKQTPVKTVSKPVALAPVTVTVADEPVVDSVETIAPAEEKTE